MYKPSRYSYSKLDNIYTSRSQNHFPANNGRFRTSTSFFNKSVRRNVEFVLVCIALDFVTGVSIDGTC